MLEVSAARLHACTKTLAPLVNALSMMLCRRHAILAANAVSVRQCRAPATGTQLDDAPDPVINRIMVRAVCWPKIRWNAGVAREVAQCPVPVCWGVVLLKNEKFPIPRTSRVVAALTGAHRGSKRR